MIVSLNLNLNANVNAVPFFHPPRIRIRIRIRIRAAAAAASKPHSSLSNSPIYHNSLRLFQNLTTSISNHNNKPCKPCANRSSSNDRPRPRDSSAAFLDENGAVEDMDGYLNHLSLEYDSVWDTKPSWCQPWTIFSTGLLIIAASWFILHSAIVTSLLLTLICAWWYIFLFSYPKAYSEMIADRRSRVKSGVEDTYGLGRLEGQNDGEDA